MNNFLAAILVCCIGLNVWYAKYQIDHAPPANTVLDADITDTKEQIADATGAVSTYGAGSLLQILASGRLETLRTTEAMLEQKRRSLLRGIELNYTADGKPWTPAKLEDLKALEADLANEQAKIDVAEAKASASQGIFSILASVEANMEHMTGALLRQRYLAAKYGLPYAGAVAEAAEKQKAVIGNLVNDANGL